MRVLIIDDEKNIRQLLLEIFELSHYEVDTSKDGESGLLQFDKKKYDLVFIDKRMPGLSGEEVLLKMREKDANVPIYIISAFQTSDEIQVLVKENLTGVLMKPFTIEQVMKIARKHLE